MKKSVPIIAVLLLLLTAGCATKGYVREQTEPISCRVDVAEAKENALEQWQAGSETRLNALENRLANIEAQLAGMPDKAMLTDAIRRADEAAQRADADARNAAASATQADQASRRAVKSFELGQKK